MSENVSNQIRRLRWLFSVLITLQLASGVCPAMFLSRGIKQVPIDRLFANLEQQRARNTNDFELTYQLARLHSMAFATNLTVFLITTSGSKPAFDPPGTDSGVPQSISLPADPAGRQIAFAHLTNAIALYNRALILLKKSTNAASQQRWLILPTELGLAWCLDQAGRRQEALEAYRKTLKIAWKIEVTGDFDLKQWVQDRWNEVRAGKLPTGSSRRSYIGPGVCYSEEVIGYLLKLLDPLKDAKEIAELKDRRQILQKMGRAVTPILVPLSAETSLADLIDNKAHLSFDLDGSGIPRQWSWITPQAAWLVFDAEGTGKITSAIQMFGSVTFWIFWRDGYAALAALDADGDGTLRGAELEGLALWQDRNSNGVSDPGEVRPVGDYGIMAISCASEIDRNGVRWSPRGVSFSGGQVRPTYDWVAECQK